MQGGGVEGWQGQKCPIWAVLHVLQGVSALTPGENEACRVQRRQEGSPGKMRGHSRPHDGLGAPGAGGGSWGEGGVSILDHPQSG